MQPAPDFAHPSIAMSKESETMTSCHRWVIAALSALLLAFSVAGGAIAADPAPSQPSKEAIEKIVRDYLLEHPEVIEEAIHVLRARKAAEEEERAGAALATHEAALYRNPMSPVSGNAGGDVTVVEFFDYQCGYCKSTLPAMLDLLRSDRNIRVIWKELPILGPVSRVAARAALAAKKQDKYLDFHIGVMGMRGQLTEDRIYEVAGKIGIDVARLQLDMKDPAIDSYLDANLQLADAIGIRGTPAFIIGGELVAGAIGADDMKRMIAKARAGG